MPRYFTSVVCALLIGWTIIGIHGCKFPSRESPASAPSDRKEAPFSPRHFQNELDRALDLCETAQTHWENGEMENALEALDNAYAVILSVDVDSDTLAQQKEDLRFLISKRILEIYASRNIVATGHHNAIPRGLNANIQQEINRFAGPEKRFFIESYKRSGRYRPMILRKLKAAGLPAELSWLPLIESGFKVEALSPARALGLWQFIPSTGYKFGLERNQHIDERIDFEKSTDAAIAYLKELHGIFGDWSTVLAAYNCGEGRVLHVIRSQNVNYLDDFWDLYNRLPYETARYVPRFLAALHLIENLEKYGLSKIIPEPPLAFETLTVQREVSLKDLAPVLGIAVDALEALNPELRHQILPPTLYTLRVPVGKSVLAMTAAIDTVPVSVLPPPAPRPSFAYHQVKKGETLSGIAKRYKTDVNTLIKLNKLNRKGYLAVGQPLKVPQRGGAAASIHAAGSALQSWSRQHVVKSGDSLWTIARRYNTTVKELQKANNLSGTTLSINQALKVPSFENRQRPPQSSKTYSVKKGETASLIARKHNIPLGHFLKMNNLTSNSTIHPGQIVRVN